MFRSRPAKCLPNKKFLEIKPFWHYVNGSTKRNLLMQYFGIGFLVLLFLEIMSIVWVADWLGGGIALLLMIASFAIGVFMLRRIGLAGVLMAGSTLRGGGVSLYQLLWPIRYTVAGMLLISPGFVSTLIAAVLLLPIKGGPTIAAGGAKPFNADFENDAGGFSNTASRTRIHRNDDIIEGEYTVTDSPENEKHNR